MSVAIINYGLGNLQSVYNAIEFIGGTPVIVDRPEALKDASHIILPGVGAFGDGMEHLNNEGWSEEIHKQALESGKPFLGICLGMQLLADNGTEHGDHEGLGLIGGTVAKLETGDKSARIPHIGWNHVEVVGENKMYGDMEEHDYYFVHSYALDPVDESVVTGRCHHGKKFVASVVKDNIWGAQFHPEKSQKGGLGLLKNFLEMS